MGWISVENQGLPPVAKVDHCCIEEDEAPITSGPLLVWDENECEQRVAELEKCTVEGTGEIAYIWRSRETGNDILGVTHWGFLPDAPDAPPISKE